MDFFFKRKKANHTLIFLSYEWNNQPNFWNSELKYYNIIKNINYYNIRPKFSLMSMGQRHNQQLDFKDFLKWPKFNKQFPLGYIKC